MVHFPKKFQMLESLNRCFPVPEITIVPFCLTKSAYGDR
jgi:hypothetical protein